MKILIRYFFKGLRIILGPLLLLWDGITSPTGIKRDPAAQQKVDKQTQKLTLYHYKTCPFCIKTRRVMKHLSLNIEKRDAQKNEQNKKDLLEGGGQIKVPCLKIEEGDGSVRWMYESDKIIEYLQNQFSQ
jgi:glutaredoxin